MCKATMEFLFPTNEVCTLCTYHVQKLLIIGRHDGCDGLWTLLGHAYPSGATLEMEEDGASYFFSPIASSEGGEFTLLAARTGYSAEVPVFAGIYVISRGPYRSLPHLLRLVGSRYGPNKQASYQGAEGI